MTRQANSYLHDPKTRKTDHFPCLPAIHPHLLNETLSAKSYFPALQTFSLANQNQIITLWIIFLCPPTPEFPLHSYSSGLVLISPDCKVQYICAKWQGCTDTWHELLWNLQVPKNWPIWCWLLLQSLLLEEPCGIHFPIKLTKKKKKRSLQKNNLKHFEEERVILFKDLSLIIPLITGFICL